MAGSQTFGRRGLSDAAPRVARTAPGPGEAPNPQLEAFRASLKGGAPEGGLGEDQAFEAWMRAQRPRRWRLIGLRLAFLAPGLFLFLFNAPTPVTLIVEALGLVANAWIKTERVRQAREIARWSAESER
jgi:hypothetical protein